MAAESLIAHVDMELSDIQHFYIAGGFGNYLDLEGSIAVGLLPDIPLERVHFIGNSSLTGAKVALLSLEALDKLEEIARKMTYVDLSSNNKFMEEYSSALFLPHTDLAKFPSVK